VKKILKLAVGFGIGGLLLWLFLRNVDIASLANAAAGLETAGIVLAPICLAVGYACRVQRWRIMLRPRNPALGFGRPAVAFLAATAVNNLVPLRAGDALRCFGFGRWLGVAPGAVMGTMLVERLLDLIALLAAFALAVFLLTPSGGWISLGAVALAFAVSVACVLALLVHPTVVSGLVPWLLRLARWFSLEVATRLEGFLTSLRDALTDLSVSRKQMALVAWTLPVWVFEGATFWIVASFMPALPVPQAAWLAMPAGTLATLLPTTPGHVGPFDYAAQMATLALGNPLVEATAFVLIVHAVLWASTTFVGLLCFAIWSFASGGKAAT